MKKSTANIISIGGVSTMLCIAQLPIFMTAGIFGGFLIGLAVINNNND